MGPSAEADAEFEKELAKMMTDTSAESRRVDRKTALALWESAALPTGLKKKRVDGFEEDGDMSASAEEPVMNFTLLTKRGKQQQVSANFSHHALPSLTTEKIDPQNRRPSGVSASYPDTHGSNAGQGGTAAVETTGVKLRATRRG